MRILETLLIAILLGKKRRKQFEQRVGLQLRDDRKISEIGGANSKDVITHVNISKG
jgi:hypothetical protein